jgi:hypothetical protein
VGVQLPRLADQHLRHIGIDAPIALFVGLGQRAARNFTAKAHVVEAWMHAPQAGFDVAEALPIGELREGQGQELVQAREALYLVLAPVTLHATAEFRQRKEIQELGENRAACVHRSLSSPRRAAAIQIDFSAECT